MNVFNAAGTAYLGPQPFAFDRAQMLAGSAATFISHGGSLGSRVGPYACPPTSTASTLPPAGAPNLSSRFPAAAPTRVYHFHVDFATPANSHLHARRQVRPPPASPRCVPPPAPACPQSGTARQAGRHRRPAACSAWPIATSASHEVAGRQLHASARAAVAGVRWFEIRNVTAGTPPSSSRAPTSPTPPGAGWAARRWTARATSPSATAPRAARSIPPIRYAGRLATDPSTRWPRARRTLFAGTGTPDRHRQPLGRLQRL